MATGWFVFRGIGPHTVCYMDGQGAETGAGGRHFFHTREAAVSAARRFGWRHYELAEGLMPWQCEQEAD
jgi:hypothetical protein